PTADERVAPSLLVHQQVEIAPAIADLGVGDAVERVRQRRADLAEQDQLVDGDRRLTAPSLGRSAGHADDVSQVDVDRPCASGVAQQLDASAAVDEIQENEFS